MLPLLLETEKERELGKKARKELRGFVRYRSGKKAPSAPLIESQSGRTNRNGGIRSYDAEKSGIYSCPILDWCSSAVAHRASGQGQGPTEGHRWGLGLNTKDLRWRRLCSSLFPKGIRAKSRRKVDWELVRGSDDVKGLKVLSHRLIGRVDLCLASKQSETVDGLRSNDRAFQSQYSCYYEKDDGSKTGLSQNNGHLASV